MTLKDRRSLESAEFDAKLAAAVAVAKTAGLKAVSGFMQTSWMVKDGIVYDAAGWAWVSVRMPSHKFRESLKRLFPKAHGFRGQWTVLGFGRDLPRGASQAITAHEIACKAALEIVSLQFPDEEFRVESHMD